MNYALSIEFTLCIKHCIPTFLPCAYPPLFSIRRLHNVDNFFQTLRKNPKKGELLIVFHYVPLELWITLPTTHPKNRLLGIFFVDNPFVLP